jgi:DNA-binding response OmpR family regulator
MKHSILLLDDEKSILFAVSEYFRAHGYIVDCARTLKQAKQRLESRNYSLLIADLRLTDEVENEGLRIVDWVSKRCPTTRIIMLTACGSPEVEDAAWARGVDVFLQKPKPLRVLALVAARLLRLDPASIANPALS